MTVLTGPWDQIEREPDPLTGRTVTFDQRLLWVVGDYEHVCGYLPRDRQAHADGALQRARGRNAGIIYGGQFLVCRDERGTEVVVLRHEISLAPEATLPPGVPGRMRAVLPCGSGWEADAADRHRLLGAIVCGMGSGFAEGRTHRSLPIRDPETGFEAEIVIRTGSLEREAIILAPPGAGLGYTIPLNDPEPFVALLVAVFGDWKEVRE